MAEYIEREAVIKLAATNKAVCSCLADIADIKEIVNDVPAVDVEPVRRGKWLKTDAYPHRVYCSECYKTYVTNEEVIQGRGWAPVYCTEAEFCPHCGAKMGGEENGRY